jgi:hypothetical protein
MSLTTLLERAEIRDRLREEFPKPPGPIDVGLAAPPLTESYSLTGTAFDYLLRWYVKKLNPQALERKWVAESALSIKVLMEEKAALDKAKQVVIQARKAYMGYLNAGGQEKPGEEVIAHAIRLALIDSVFRSGILRESTFSSVNGRVVEDLTCLIELVKPRDFLMRKLCVLNPTFGEASKLVGGADGDLLLDEMLIELKTTKALELERTTFDQLIGYYILSRIGGIAGLPQQHRVGRLAVYYSRYGVFWEIWVRQVIDEKRLPELIRWFKKAAARANVSLTRTAAVLRKDGRNSAIAA